MGYVPTHGPDCFKVYSYATTCSGCNAQIIYFECSCGSKIFLNPPDEGLHDCGNSPKITKADRAGLLIYLIDLANHDKSGKTQCPMCDTVVKNDKNRVRKHFKKCPKRKEWFPL